MLLIDNQRSGDITISQFSREMLDECVEHATSDSNVFVLFLDVETTGLSYENDKIIQLACRPAVIDRSTGKISRLVTECKTFFNDPGVVITDEITRLTGVSNEDVKGQSINWGWLSGVMNKVDFVVAHNVRFDRHFVKKHMVSAGIEMPEKVWACSMSQIDWRKVCTAGKSLETLCAWHGFYYESHNATADVDAMICLLAKSGFFPELLDTASKSQFRVFAVNFPRNKNDELKARKYRWDPDVRLWWAGCESQEKVDLEVEWLNKENGVEPQVFEVKPEHLFD